MEVLLDEVRVWVKEQKPRTSEEAGKLSEDYRQTRKAELWTSTSAKAKWKACYLCGQVGHLVKDCPTKPVGQPAFSRNLLCDTTVVVQGIYVLQHCPSNVLFCVGLN